MGGSVRPEVDLAEAVKNLKAQGAPDEAIHAYIKQQGYSPAEDKPQHGAFSRAGDMIASTAKQFVAHPIDTAASLITAPFKSLGTMLAPGVGENRTSAALSKGGNSSGRPIDTSPYDAEHGGVTSSERNAAGVQTAANILFPGVAGGVAGKLGGGAISKALGLAVGGGMAGAAYSPDDPIAGGLAGAALAPALHGATKGAARVLGGGRSVVGPVISKALDLAGRPDETRAVTVGPMRLGSITGMGDLATDAISRRTAMDAAAGHQSTPMHSSVPPMALDAAGPNVEGLAEGIANRPGPGRSTIVGAVEGRQKIMRPALTQTLEKNTGVPATARMAPLEDAMNARTKDALAMYDKAKQETGDIPIVSPTYERIAKTPVGQSADAFARAQMSNRLRSLPTIEQAGGESTALKEMVGMGIPREKAISTLGEGAMDPPSRTEVPNAEYLHYFKQHLAKTARLGMNDGAKGIDAVTAQGALERWGDIRKEIPPQFGEADDVFAGHSRKIEAIDAGRNITSARINPPGPARRAVRQSLSAVIEKHTGEPEAFQTGAATAAHNLLDTAPTSTKSPGRIFARTPERVEQTAQAFPSPDKAADFQHAVQSWDRVQEQSQRLTGNSRTGLRGAEGSGKGDIQPSSLLDPRRFARKIINKLGGEAQSEHQQRLEGEIAKMLTGSDLPEPRAVPPKAPSKLLAAINQYPARQAVPSDQDRQR